MAEKEPREIASEILNELSTVFASLSKSKARATEHEKRIDNLMADCFDFWKYAWERVREKTMSEDAYKLIRHKWDDIKRISSMAVRPPSDILLRDAREKLSDLRLKLEKI